MTDKRKAFKSILKKLEKLLAHFGNASEPEAHAALRKANALLRSVNLDWHDLVALMSAQKDTIWDILTKLLEKDPDALVRLGRRARSSFIPAQSRSPTS